MDSEKKKELHLEFQSKQLLTTDKIAWRSSYFNKTLEISQKKCFHWPIDAFTPTFAISVFKEEFFDLSCSNSACNCTTCQEETSMIVTTSYMIDNSSKLIDRELPHFYWRGDWKSRTKWNHIHSLQRFWKICRYSVICVAKNCE